MPAMRRSLAHSITLLFSEFHDRDEFIGLTGDFDSLDRELIDFGLQLMVSDAEHLAEIAYPPNTANVVSFPRPPPSAYCIFVLMNKREQDVTFSHAFLKNIWTQVSVSNKAVYLDRAFDELRRYHYELWCYNQFAPPCQRLQACVPEPLGAEADSGVLSIKKCLLDRMRHYPTTYSYFAKYFDKVTGSHLRNPAQRIPECRAQWNQLSRVQLKQLYHFQSCNPCVKNASDLGSYVDDLDP